MSARAGRDACRTPNARAALCVAGQQFASAPPCQPIDTALDNALVTPEHIRDPALVGKLDAVACRLFGHHG